MTVVCETDRLIIRHFQLSDAEFIVRLLNEESFIRYIADKNVRTNADAENYLLNGPLNSYKTFGFGLNLIELKSSRTPVGMCGLLKRTELDHPDIGFAFLPEFCGKGFAHEATLSVLNDGFSTHALQTILAVTLPDNVSSNDLLRKAGFNAIGKMELYGSENNVYEYRVKNN
jgi:RimJ/RimL family protein N-acetyltransferase